MAAARTSPMPFSVASSFSEAELMSMGSDFLAVSALGASAFFASALGASVVVVAFVLGVSAFWASAAPLANARPSEARVATSVAWILCMVQLLLRGWWWFNGGASVPVDLPVGTGVGRIR